VILLLDSHTLLWAIGSPAELSEGAHAALIDPANDVIVSAASVWEIAIKRALGKLRAPQGIAGAIEALGFSAVPITAADAERAGSLPPHHRDPFDRMLIAQATRLDAIIVSRDAAFGPYEVAVIRA